MTTVSLILSGLLLMILAVTLWNALAWPSLTRRRQLDAASVSVLIPARNEEANIRECLASALAQGAGVLEAIVYDDKSTDATAALVRSISATDARVRLLPGVDLPPGWGGKNHACARLAEAARGPWLLFLDADARMLDGTVERLLAEAADRRVTMVSPWPSLATGSFWESVLMPMLDVLTFSLYPAPLSFLRDDPSLGLVHGACILMRRDLYEAVGGHTAIKGEILEDQRLAQLWRERGHRGLCVHGRTAVRVRMYRSLGEIWRGFRKNFYPAFRHAWSFWGFLLLHVTIFLLPLLSALRPMNLLHPLSFTPLLLLLAIRTVLALRFGHPLWSVLFHPVAEMILVGIALSSWWQCRSGRGVEWKGRQYQVVHVQPRTSR
jgi:glycosyltransferase involved in cell wall biosynthesis